MKNKNKILLRMLGCLGEVGATLIICVSDLTNRGD